MSRLSSASHARLNALGISAWRSRDLPQPGTAPCLEDTGLISEPAGQSERPPQPGQEQALGSLSIRLSPGSGDWLLVQQAPWRGAHADLMDDIKSCLGPARCRFGQWASDSAAGERSEELAQRGVRHILSFGPPPKLVEWPTLIVVPSLDELATSAEARRQLWQAIGPFWSA